MPRYSAKRMEEIIEAAARFAEHDPGVDWPSEKHEDPVDAICAALDAEREQRAVEPPTFQNGWGNYVPPKGYVPNDVVYVLPEGFHAERRLPMLRERVHMRYGIGTVVAIIPDESGQEREPVAGVVADVGGYWICRLEELTLTGETLF